MRKCSVSKRIWLPLVVFVLLGVCLIQMDQEWVQVSSYSHHHDGTDWDQASIERTDVGKNSSILLDDHYSFWNSSQSSRKTNATPAVLIPVDTGSQNAIHSNNISQLSSMKDHKKHVIATTDNVYYTINTSLPPYFSVARYDRSGSVIQDMLRAHAFAFANNRTYGGACVCCNKKRRAQQRRAPTEALLKELGLDTVLPYACPPGDYNFSHVSNDHRATNNIAKLFNQRHWKEFLYSQWGEQSPAINPQKKKKKKNDETILMAVHIRRGDVTPCNYPDRYRPNSHYLRLIETYSKQLPQNQNNSSNNMTIPNVTIFSESSSFESFQDFIQRNYTLRLDTELSEVWWTLMTAHIVITSVSSFSYVPAVLNWNGTIIHTTGGQPPLAHWIVPDQSSISTTQNTATGSGQQNDLVELRRSCWRKNGTSV